MDLSVSFPAQTLVVITGVIIVYLVFVLFLGLYFSRFSSSINDFFFSGQRFSWWLPAMSMVATGIGSYSYLKYSEQGLNTGMSSSHVYMNDWFLFPVFLFAWLPILYFNRIKSVPEYFEKRFNKTAGFLSIFIILSYIFYYIGYNLFTIGVAIEGVFGVSPLLSLPLIALLIGVYVTMGGQTAVIFTDLFQGIILYFVGFIVIGCGLYALGGLGEFWSYLPESHRLPLAPFQSDPYFNTPGIFWGDALAGGIAFIYMNQGFLMRFLTIRSLSQARIAACVNLMITVPVSALIIGGTGWIAKSILSKQAVLGQALEGYQQLTIENSYHTFLTTAFEVIQRNDLIMGFIFAALISALMSTVDSLINASAAIGIYNIYKPLVRPKADQKHYLNMARLASIASTIIGLLLVIWFYKQKGTLMSIHYKGIMLIIPPVVTTIFLGVFWKNFHAFSACVSMCVGILAAFLTIIFPQPVFWMRELLMGVDQGELIYFRAPFGIVVTAVSGMICQWIFSAPSARFEKLKKIPLLSSVVRIFSQGMEKDIKGLTVDSLKSAMIFYKGGEPNQAQGKKVKNLTIKIDDHLNDSEIILSEEIARRIKAEAGDLVYLADQRWFLGGVRSGHFRLKDIQKNGGLWARISKKGQTKSFLLDGKKLFVEKTI